MSDDKTITPVGLPTDVDIQTRVMDRIKALPDGANGALIIYGDRLNGAKVSIATKLSDSWQIDAGVELTNYQKINSLNWHVEIVKTW